MIRLESKHLLAVGVLAGLATLVVKAAAADAAGVEGTVVEGGSGAPVSGALVAIADLGLIAVSESDGRFSFPPVSLASESQLIDLTVTASGYGDWTLQDARLIAGDTLILDVQIGAEPTLIVVPPPRAEAPDWPAELPAEAFQGGFGMLQANQPLPATIRVRVTGYPYCDYSRPYTVETVDFREYAKHVLPNEWVASWPYESLRAGAMAVKMYAWSYIAVGGKWPDADVYDSTCDQVYNPAVSYSSTNKAVDFTWNWRLTRNDQLLRTFYRAYYSQCEDVGLGGNCMGQVESSEMAYDQYTWDEILAYFYDNSALSPVWSPPGGFSLRFYGNGYGDLDRVKIPIDPPVPADVGAADFTIEWWMKALASENTAGDCVPGGDNWIYGNIIFDRDVYGDGDYGDYGISLAGGRLAFGVAAGSTRQTICGNTDVADGIWHHLAVTRSSSGSMQTFVDGQLDASGTGPTGDVSYRDGRSTSYSNDPFLVLGAEKHDLNKATYPSFSGWLDEIRLSDLVRYASAFAVPAGRFSPDVNTVALYHLNEGYGNVITDISGAAGGPSSGTRRYGGVLNGPEWTDDTNWYVPPPTPTPTATFTASPTPSASPSSTPTSGPSQTPSLTPSATPTGTATPTQTATPTPTASSTPSPTATNTPSATPTPTATSSPTATFTPVPSTATPTPTSVPTVGSTQWMLAEGYTGDGTSTFILIQNPNPSPATVDLTYLLDGGDPIHRTHVVPAESRTTIAAHDPTEVGPDQAFATVLSSDLPIVVERAMYWPGGGHATIGLTDTATEWRLAEGYTGSGFQTFILIQNPNPSPTTVQVTYLLDGGEPITHTHIVPAESRTTIAAHDPTEVGPDQAFATVLSSDLPIVVERAMYWGEGGHATIGLTQPDTGWRLAEGYTGSGFQTFILIQNPNPSPATVDLTYLLDGGDPIHRTHVVPAESRTTIAAHDPTEVGPDQAFATVLSSDLPIVVERAMYWPGGGHATIGLTDTATEWRLAEGYTGSGFQTFILIQNPNPFPATVQVTYLLDGGEPITHTHIVPAESRTTITAHDPTEVGPDQAFATVLSSDLPIVVERAMYWAEDGHVTIGVH